jgi:hypothetical protein
MGLRIGFIKLFAPKGQHFRSIVNGIYRSLYSKAEVHRDQASIRYSAHEAVSSASLTSDSTKIYIGRLINES